MPDKTAAPSRAAVFLSPGFVCDYDLYTTMRMASPRGSCAYRALFRPRDVCFPHVRVQIWGVFAHELAVFPVFVCSLGVFSHTSWPFFRCWCAVRGCFCTRAGPLPGVHVRFGGVFAHEPAVFPAFVCCLGVFLHTSIRKGAPFKGALFKSLTTGTYFVSLKPILKLS